MPEKALTRLRISASSAGERAKNGKSRPEDGRNRVYTATSRSLFGNGSGRSSTALITVKMAAFDPMPRASVRAAAIANAGRFRNVRAAYRRSCQRSLSTWPAGAPGAMDGDGWACRSGARRRARRSTSLKPASASRVASSGVAPPAINSRQRSSRCCESSSTISASRAGERRSVDSRGRTCWVQSGMFVSRDALHSFHECRPRLALLGKHAPSFSRDPIEPPPPLLRFLDPRALDPSALLQAIEQRVEGINVECQMAAGARVDQFAQLVAVARPGVKQGEDEQLGGSPLQLAIERAAVDICHEQILFRQASKVKRNPGDCQPPFNCLTGVPWVYTRSVYKRGTHEVPSLDLSDSGCAMHWDGLRSIQDSRHAQRDRNRSDRFRRPRRQNHGNQRRNGDGTGIGPH